MNHAGILMMLLWSLVAGHVTFVTTAAEPAVIADGRASVECRESGPVMRTVAGMTLADFRHELVHYADCDDDGILNGSVGPRMPVVTPVWLVVRDSGQYTARYCMTQIEYPACVAQWRPDLWR